MIDYSAAQNTVYSQGNTLIDLDVTTVEEAKREAATKFLIERVGLTLDKYYPGYAWRVSMEGGLIKILNYSLSGDCGIRITPDEIDVEGKAVMRYAGQLLEMYRVARGAMPEVVTPDTDYSAFSQLGGAMPKRVKQEHDLTLAVKAGIQDMFKPPQAVAA